MTPPTHPLTIAIDLTPILPGGDNGGAKIFVLELIRRLAQRHPGTHFMLLTAAVSHGELAALDAVNVSRRLVVHQSAHRATASGGLRGLLQRMTRLLPDRLARPALRIAYATYARLRSIKAQAQVRQLDYDLLFCPFTAPNFARKGAPVVATVYDFQYKAYPEFFSPEDVLHRDQAFRTACTAATCLAAISEFSRQQAIALGALAPDRIETVHLQMATRVTKHTEAAFGIANGVTGPYLVYPANFWRHKNHEMLLTGFAMACARGLSPEIKLVLTGAPGARQTYIAECAKRFGIGSRVVMPGFLDEAAFSNLLRLSTGVIFPSLYEGFGLPVIEAMAAGIPVACSDTTALPEIAGDAALFFDPRRPDTICEAILTLTSPQFDAAAARMRGIERAALFSDADAMADRYWSLFAKAMAASHGPRPQGARI
jgi:glycosyltransferase involved in cell wall biosynthesis